MRRISLAAATIWLMLPVAAYSQCAPDDTICNQAQADMVRQQQEYDRQRTEELNRQNGASQYSGPKCYTSENGNFVCGGQLSTR